MQMVKIQIPDKGESAHAGVILARQGRVDCYAGDVYIVPVSALKALDAMAIGYVEIERGGVDFAEKTLRVTLAAHAQRRAPPQPRKVPADA